MKGKIASIRKKIRKSCSFDTLVLYAKVSVKNTFRFID